ncbi:hypothetical protein THAOC_08146 [Thalassiosira oceanica]|uniref:WW domain-containing protein n=1 Tax=Thalassiosira oceanica TaxID=159749 RepID=K0TAM4_THAOC|nr:hypothetical protein THAOC_08146 [Thalassiosira oceanica]|eukprot:EJK70491.1 hypothetical protein THAOC_08146 [Thalassiosira oceanica]
MSTGDDDATPPGNLRVKYGDIEDAAMKLAAEASLDDNHPLRDMVLDEDHTHSQSEWAEHKDPWGNPFFCNYRTNEVTYQRPEALQQIGRAGLAVWMYGNLINKKPKAFVIILDEFGVDAFIKAYNVDGQPQKSLYSALRTAKTRFKNENTRKVIERKVKHLVALATLEENEVGRTKAGSNSGNKKSRTTEDELEKTSNKLEKVTLVKQDAKAENRKLQEENDELQEENFDLHEGKKLAKDKADKAKQDLKSAEDEIEEKEYEIERLKIRGVAII